MQSDRHQLKSKRNRVDSASKALLEHLETILEPNMGAGHFVWCHGGRFSATIVGNYLGGLRPPDPPLNGFASSASLANFDYENHISLLGAFNMLSMLFLTQGKASTHTHVPHKRPPTTTLTHTHNAPTFVPHTKGRTTLPMGRARSARPIGTVVGAREARANPLCVVRMLARCECVLGVWYECWHVVSVCFVCGRNVGAL